MAWARQYLDDTRAAAQTLRRAANRIETARARAYSLGSPGAPRYGSSGHTAGDRMATDICALVAAEGDATRAERWAAQQIAEFDALMQAASDAVTADTDTTARTRLARLDAIDMAIDMYRDLTPERDEADAYVYGVATVRRRVAALVAWLDTQPRAWWLGGEFEATREAC